MIGHEFVGTYALEGSTSFGTKVAFAIGNLTIVEGATPIEACYLKITAPNGEVQVETALKTETFGLMITLIHQVFQDAVPFPGEQLPIKD